MVTKWRGLLHNGADYYTVGDTIFLNFGVQS